MKKLKFFGVILLLLTSFIFAEKVLDLPELNRPFFIRMDDERLYITDGPTISIYSLKDYSFVKRFGKSGDGPREFRVNPNRSAGSVVIALGPDYILANSLTRIAYFKKDGTFIKERKTSIPGGRLQPIGNNFVGESFIQDNNKIYMVKNLHDSNFKFIKELHRRENFFQQEGDLNPFYSTPTRCQIYDNKIFINGTEEDVVIHVFDSSGNKIYNINHRCVKTKVTEEYEKGIRNWYRTYLGVRRSYNLVIDRLKFPKYFPAIRMFHVANQKVYVLTYLKKNEESEFLIFYIKGKFLKKIVVPLAEKDERLYYPYTIGNGKIYQLIENEDEEVWELHVAEIK